MKLTAEVVDETIKLMKDYQKIHFGTPNGQDFPLIAEELSRSKTFTEICLQQGMVGVFLAVALPKKGDVRKETPDTFVDAFVDDIKSSPIRDGLALMFYAGFKLGQRFGETQQLENLVRGEENDSKES